MPYRISIWISLLQLDCNGWLGNDFFFICRLTYLFLFVYYAYFCSKYFATFIHILYRAFIWTRWYSREYNFSRQFTRIPVVIFAYFIRLIFITGEDPMLSDQQQYRYMTVDDMKSMGDDSMRVNVTDDERDNRHSGGT